MKFLVFAAIVAGCFSSFGVNAQEYNYFHYDLKDGLSGLTVYTAVQDKDGFMWFGTDAGLSRFDGAQFKNFTTNDGLPDNEVLKLYADSKNRLWILSFSHIISYYQNGKIHSPNNDSLLRKITLSSEPVDIREDKYGNIVLLENTAFHIVDDKGNVQSYKKINGVGFWSLNLGINMSGNVVVSVISEKLFSYGWATAELDGTKLTGKVVLVSSVSKYITRLSILFRENIEVYREFDKIYVRNKKDSVRQVLRVPVNFNGLSYISDSLFTLNSDDTVFLYNSNQKRICDKFIMGKVVNCCIRDSEGNFWFATSGYGVYRLTSNVIRNYNLSVENVPMSVYALYKNDTCLFAGTNRSLLWSIDRQNKMSPVAISEGPGAGMINNIIENRQHLMFGSSFGLFCYYKGIQQQIGLSFSSKSFCKYRDTLLLSTNRNVIRVDAFKHVIYDTIWTNRSTCAYRFDNKYFIGALDGLYMIDNDKLFFFMGKKEPLLSSRVSALTGSGDTLWVGTFGNGVMAYNNGRVVLHIGENNGLTSNNCRALYFDKGILWVATDKGLNGVSLDSGHYNISTYATKDGLNCGIINCLLEKNDTVYLGTPYGIIYFNPNEVNNVSIAALLINSIKSKQSSWTPDAREIVLKPQDNSLRIDFSCISFKSQGDIRYYYRISGLDTNWKTTRENILDYASLPSGSYLLELYAINAFGVKSNVVRLNVTVEKPFYFTTWFIIIVIAAIIVVVWLTTNRRIRKIMRRESEKTVLQKKISDLEQLALRSQMNPHFIFNCLNSIQQYVFDKNVIDANRFISGFSSLIRQTLDLSSKKLITLEEEIKYLDTYIKLEHARFEHSFQYRITADKSLQPEQLYLPSLLLQPFVENSIRHGIRNLKGTNGKILITFSAEGAYLLCIIEDNGVGRKVATQLKGLGGSNYDSRGLSLVQQRIDALNAVNSEKISIKVEDVDPSQLNTGTRVIIHLPFESDVN